MALESGAAGKLIVISAPSGSGKTTIAREVTKRNPTVRFSVSATTRPKRPREMEGKDYYFLSREEFRRRVDKGEFVEWEEMFGHCYGTLRSEVSAALRRGQHILFDVDVKGGLSIKRQFSGALMIFIRTPTIEVLRERLLQRKTETEAMLASRLERVPMELKLGEQYEHQIVNDDLQRAVKEVQEIVQSYLQS